MKPEIKTKAIDYEKLDLMIRKIIFENRDDKNNIDTLQQYTNREIRFNPAS